MKIETGILSIFFPIGNDLNYYGSLIEDSHNSYKEITNIKRC